MLSFSTHFSGNNFIIPFQITSASKEEYLQKIEQIKKEPAIQEFIQKHRTSITLYGLLYEWLREIFVHILKTTEGEKTLTHVWTEMEIILKDEKVLNMIRTILSKSEQVLTSEQGPKNTIILAEYFKSALTVPKFLTLVTNSIFCYLREKSKKYQNYSGSHMLYV